MSECKQCGAPVRPVDTHGMMSIVVYPEICEVCARERELQAEDAKISELFRWMIASSEMPAHKVQQVMRARRELLPQLVDLRRDPEARSAWLYGEPGSYKTTQLLLFGITHAMAEARRIAASGTKAGWRSVRYVTEPDVFSSIVDAGWSDAAFRDVDVLLVDETGVAKYSEWKHSTWFSVLDSRYANGKLTLFASNWEPDDARLTAMYDRRLNRRVREMMGDMKYLVKMGGEA